MQKIIPLLSLAALIAAAGSAAGIVTTKETSPVTAAEQEPERELARFCSNYWGTLSADLCRFEQTFHFNKVHVGSAPLITHVPVIAGDSLSVLASESALPMVGKRIYPSRSFLAESEGYLSFMPIEGAGAFSLGQVSLKRCFSDARGTIESVPCPR